MALPKLQDIFLHAGVFYARYPILTITFTLLAVALSGGGIIHLKITNDPIELWVDKSATKYQQKMDKTAIFGDDFRIENLLFKPRKQPAEGKLNVIDKEYLREIYYFQKVLLQLKTTVNEKEYGIKDLCWKAFADGECVVQSPTNYWQNVLERLESDPDIDSTVSCFKSMNPFNSIACMDENKIPVVSEAVFGGIWKESLDSDPKKTTQGSEDERLTTCRKSKNSLLTNNQRKLFGKPLKEDSDPCGLFKVRAETLSLSVLLESTPEFTEVYEQFEKEAIEMLIKLFNDNEDTTFFQKWIPDIKVEPLKLRITYMLQRSVNDELADETSQNYIIVVISYALMFIYVSCSLSKHWNSVGSSILLSLSGLIYIVLSVFVTYSLCGLFGVTANLISLEVIPFLILAIGVDNMFLIYNSVLKVPSDDINLKIPVGLRSVGLSILLSTFTQIATFIVGLYMGIPALRSFCIIAAIALFCNFFFQVTAFPALVAIDLRRKRVGNMDLLPCKKSTKYTDEELKKFINNSQKTDCFYKMFEKCWTPCVLSLPCKIVTLIFCTGLLITCVPALINLPLGLDQQNTTLVNGNLHEYFGDLKKYLEIGPQSYIIFKNADWTDIETYNTIDRLMDFLSQKEGLIASSFRVWYQGMYSLQDSQYTNPDMINVCFKGKDPDDYFVDINKLAKFYLTLGLNDPCCSSFSICGGQFYQDVTFDRKNQIKNSRIIFMHQRLRTQQDFIESMTQITELVDYFVENMMDPEQLQFAVSSGDSKVEEAPKVKEAPKMFDAYPYSLYYIFFEQYSYVKGITVQNYFLALMFLFCFVSCLYSAFTSLILVVIVILISSNLWSLMWIQNYILPGLTIEFNAVLVVNLIIAIGFSVEFCIHLIVKFRKAKGNKRARIKTALNEIGSLVFQGIFLTKLIGLSVLVFSPIPLFRLYYFRVYITMIILCGFYGLVVTPIILELFTFEKTVNRRSITDYFVIDSKDKIKDEFNPKKPEKFNQGNLKSPTNEKIEDSPNNSSDHEKENLIENPNEEIKSDLEEPLNKD